MERKPHPAVGRKGRGSPPRRPCPHLVPPSLLSVRLRGSERRGERRGSERRGRRRGGRCGGRGGGEEGEGGGSEEMRREEAVVVFKIG
jgi:hypothetical protein